MVTHGAVEFELVGSLFRADGHPLLAPIACYLRETQYYLTVARFHAFGDRVRIWLEKQGSNLPPSD
jgi:hypothetical protein